jgi:tRNA pseudouridine38-40 synthase
MHSFYYGTRRRNPGARTIEGELFQALVSAGAVSQDNSNDPKKVGFARCARTDKGVHAAGNVVSLKMIVDIDDLVPRINSFLPQQFRVWGFVRTTGSFSSKDMCDSRVYEYLLPSYVLKPPHDMYRALWNKTTVAEETVPTERIAEMRAYKIPSDVLERFRETLSGYEKTKNYHNYTTGKPFKDTSAKRYILGFTACLSSLINERGSARNQS